MSANTYRTIFKTAKCAKKKVKQDANLTKLDLTYNE